VAKPITHKLQLDDMTVDWVWISLLALWQRWWPDRPGLELLDDKMQAGYARDAENDSHAAVVTWLDAWSDTRTANHWRSSGTARLPTYPDPPTYSTRMMGCLYPPQAGLKITAACGFRYAAGRISSRADGTGAGGERTETAHADRHNGGGDGRGPGPGQAG
jgi:hypothetical protein